MGPKGLCTTSGPKKSSPVQNAILGNLVCSPTPTPGGAGKGMEGGGGVLARDALEGREVPPHSRVKQDKSSGGSIDITKTRSGPQRVRMSSGERGKQSNTEALCQSPRRARSQCPGTVPLTASAGVNRICNRQ